MGLLAQYDLANDTRFIQATSAAVAAHAAAVLLGAPSPDDELLAGMVLREPDLWARRFASLIAQADTQITKANAETRLPNVTPTAWPLMVRAATREAAIGNG